MDPHAARRCSFRTVKRDSPGAYDADNRETGEVWKNNSGVTVNVVTYAYDADNNRTSAADSSGTLTYTYDALNRVQSYANVFGQVLTYGYDANDNQTLRQDSLGGVLTSVYDAANRLTSQQFGGTGQTAERVDFGYDVRDEQTSRTWYTDLAGTSVLATSVYAFDDAGTYTYDAAGNTLTKSKGTGLETWYYGWDNRNRLTSVRETTNGTTNELTVTYTYDVQNNLVQEDKWKTGGSVITTRHAYDGAKVWADLDAGNNVQVRYLFDDGTDQILTRTVTSGANAGLAAYLTDNLGSVRDLLQASTGTVQTHVDYSGFGTATVVAGGAYGDYIKYTGRWDDADTGLQNDRCGGIRFRPAGG